MREDLVIGRGGPGDLRAIPLATKRGTHIRNERRLERPPDGLRAAVRLVAQERPLARFRSITNTYNCVGMAFASRRTWVDIDEIRLILNEDGYRQIEAPEIGDIVIYRNPEYDVKHVGVVLENRPLEAAGKPVVMVLSKWGGDGEYIHAVDYVPEALGRPTDYWTERVEAP